jgi:hypothetical protein
MCLGLIRVLWGTQLHSARCRELKRLVCIIARANLDVESSAGGQYWIEKLQQYARRV